MKMIKRNIIKRDGKIEKLQLAKIIKALEKCDKNNMLDLKTKANILEDIVRMIDTRSKDFITVEEIQDIVEESFQKNNQIEIGKAYSNYRKERTRVRMIKTDLMNSIEKIGMETDRDNANVGNNFSSKLLRIASETNKWFNLATMPKELSKLHENGDLYYHDLDSYNLTVNCLHIPTKEVLKNGFNTGYGFIRPPKRIESAAELSCILLQSTQNDMFGGQSHPNFDNDLSLYVEMTRKKIKKEYIKIGVPKHDLNKEVEKKVNECISQSMQGIVYNLNTMHSRAGSQVPFSSVNIGIPFNKDSALICESFLIEYEKGLGKSEQPIFPNIIFRVKDGVNKKPSDPYYYLFELACRVASKRMNPTFMNIDSDFNKEYYDKGYMPATMGCRTYTMSNINGEAGTEGRGNIAPVTINFPRIGILSKGDIDKFFTLLDIRLNQSVESLMHRYNVLKKLKVKDLPFVVGQHLMKGSENLLDDDSIEPILKQGTWGIGFIGLAETLIALTGKHHGECEKSRELGVKIISYVREFCDKKKEELKLNFSCYATPAEGLSSKFIDIDKKVFGEIKGVTDKEYYTNSFHVPVGYEIPIFKKIDIEAPYHKLCNGGHISYIEVDNYPNAELIQKIIQYAYTKTNISYMGVNFHIRYCKECGTYLNHEQKCFNCGSTNIQGVSRVTGYLSLDERFTKGKVAEREDRISHETSKNMYTDIK